MRNREREEREKFEFSAFHIIVDEAREHWIAKAREREREKLFCSPLFFFGFVNEVEISTGRDV